MVVFNALFSHLLHICCLQIEIWECSGAVELSEASVEAARRGAGDPTANASGARLLASLEPPIKPKDTFWGGSGSCTEADAAADADPKGALEKILNGKSGERAGLVNSCSLVS